MNTIYKTIIFSFALLVFQGVFAQSLQTYSGNYDLSGDYFWVKGQATYTYKELADYTKVREGSFQFNSDMKGEEFGQSYRSKFIENVSGQYKNNAKNGLWQYNMQLIHVGEMNGSVETRANYKNGKPHGSWNMDLKSLSTGAITENMNMTFNNGTIVGAFKKINSELGTEVSGTCDENGYLNGKVVTKEFGEELIREFSHGVMQLYVLRDEKTGEVKERKTADKETLEIFAKLQNLAKTNPAELENMSFKLVENVAEFDKIYVETIISVLQLSDFPGDSLYSDRDEQYYWNGFKVLDIEKQEPKAEREARLAAEAAQKAAAEKERAEKIAAEEKARAEKEAAKAEEEAARKQKIALENKVNELVAKRDEKAKAVEQAITKKRVIAAYTLVVDAYKAKYNAASDNVQKIEILDKYIKLYDKLLSLAPKMSELEDKLKVAKTAEEVEKALGL